MKSPKINLDFSKFSDADFDASARHIDESITGNPNFITPNPSNLVRSAATAKYTASLAVAEGLGRLQVAEKNADRRSRKQLQFQCNAGTNQYPDGSPCVSGAAKSESAATRERTPEGHR